MEQLTDCRVRVYASNGGYPRPGHRLLVGNHGERLVGGLAEGRALGAGHEACHPGGEVVAGVEFPASCNVPQLESARFGCHPVFVFSVAAFFAVVLAVQLVERVLNSSFVDDERGGEFFDAHGRFGNGEDRFDGAFDAAGDCLDLGEFGFGIDRHAGCGGGASRRNLCRFRFRFIRLAGCSFLRFLGTIGVLYRFGGFSLLSFFSNLGFFGHLTQRRCSYLVLSRLSVRLSRL